MIPRRPARAPARACGPRFPRGWFARTAPALAPPADSGSGRSTRRCALGLEAPEPGLELIEVALILHRRPESAAGAPRRRLHRLTTLPGRRGGPPPPPPLPAPPRARRVGRAAGPAG